MLDGIDVSKYQGAVDWGAMTQSPLAPPLSFALCRASYGDTHYNPSKALDAYLVRNWRGALDAGLFVGAYHYFLPREDLSDIGLQVDTYLSQVRSAMRVLDMNYLPAIIDVEELPESVESDTYLKGVTAWINAVEADSIFAGMKCIIYTRASVWSELGSSSAFSDRPIWVADYSKDPPRVPPQWNTWSFWQYSETGARAGVAPLDLDRFNGDIGALRAMTRAGNLPLAHEEIESLRAGKRYGAILEGGAQRGSIFGDAIPPQEAGSTEGTPMPDNMIERVDALFQNVMQTLSTTVVEREGGGALFDDGLAHVSVEVETAEMRIRLRLETASAGRAGAVPESGFDSRLIPLQLDSADLTIGQMVPAKGEVAVCGAIRKKIARTDPEFATLVRNTNGNITFKDEEGTGADRMMSQGLSDKLDALADLVMKEWAGSCLRVTEAWDENNEHAGLSLHYEGRAADLTTDPVDGDKLGRLGRLAVDAGCNWVWFENEKHVHVSVPA